MKLLMQGQWTLSAQLWRMVVAAEVLVWVLWKVLAPVLVLVPAQVQALGLQELQP